MELSPKYYYENFLYLLKFVEEKYKHVLVTEEWRFLRKFYALNENEQCLFIRLVNRKHIFFKTSSLNYTEIEDLKTAVESLCKKKFFKKLKQAEYQKLELLLPLFTKAELAKVSRNLPKNVSKQKLQDYLLSCPEQIEPLLEKEILEVLFQQEVRFLKFLFFGNRYMDMSEFVIRDLGYMNYYQHDDSKLVARFSDRKDAEDKWFITGLVEEIESRKENNSPSELLAWALPVLENRNNFGRAAHPEVERFGYHIAKHLEKVKFPELALKMYEKLSGPPSKERRVRILFKLAKKAEAYELLQEMFHQELFPEERLFALDFLSRHYKEDKIKTKATTRLLKEADSITISEKYRGQVEQGTMEYYLSQGKNAIFSENYLWRALFGLTFWEVLFDAENTAFHHPFQRKPSDLNLPDFYEKREKKIKSILASIENTEDFVHLLKRSFDHNFGIANPFVFWEEEFWPAIQILALQIELKALKEILHHMSKNIVEHTRGFPDLFVWDHSGYEFIEVKSPNDSLSNRQLYWLRYFKRNSINAKVLRVYFSPHME